MFEAVILEPARSYRLQLDEDDRAEVDRLIALIELDPRIDGVHKFIIAIEHIHFTVYNNGTWQIAYSIVDSATIAIRAIARVGSSSGPHLRM